MADPVSADDLWTALYLRTANEALHNTSQRYVVEFPKGGVRDLAK
jgi:hypothetical protein